MPTITPDITRDQRHDQTEALNTGRELQNGRSIHEAMAQAGNSFRAHGERVRQARDAFSQTSFAGEIASLVGNAARVNLGVKAPSRDGTLKETSLEEYRTLYDLNSPKVGALAVESALEKGRIEPTTVQKAVDLPALEAFRQAARQAIEPTAIAELGRRRSVQEFKRLNAAAPEGDITPSFSPMVVQTPGGDMSIAAFTRGNERAVVLPRGFETALVTRSEVTVFEDRTIGRTIPRGGLLDTYPTATNAEKVAMLKDLASMGWIPLSAESLPSLRENMPPMLREHGAPTLGAMSLNRLAEAIGNGAIKAAIQGPAAYDRLPAEDQPFAEHFGRVKDSLEVAGIRPQAAIAALTRIERPLVALAELSQEFHRMTSRDGAHADPTFAMKEFLVQKYELPKADSPDAFDRLKASRLGPKNIPLDDITAILNTRDQSTIETSTEGFGRARHRSTAQTPVVHRSESIDRIHERLADALDLYLKDAQGQKIPVMVEREGQNVHEQWTGSGRPRYMTELDAVLSDKSGFQDLVTMNRLAADLDEASRDARLNLTTIQIRLAYGRTAQAEKLLQVANAYYNEGQDLKPLQRSNFERDLAELDRVQPGLGEMRKLYAEGPIMVASQLKIDPKEFERSAFAAARLLETRNGNPLASFPLGTYSAPAHPSSTLVVMPDSAQLKTFTALVLRRRADGGELGTFQFDEDRRGMDFNDALAYMREKSLGNAYVAYSAKPASEFVIPYNDRGLPSDGGEKRIRLNDRQAQMAHALRMPIMSRLDPTRDFEQHKFALFGVSVQHQTGAGADLIPPGYYRALMSRGSIVPRSFEMLYTDEQDLASRVPKDQMVEALVKKGTKLYEARAFADDFYARQGRYSYREASFSEGSRSHGNARDRAIGVMQVVESYLAERSLSQRLRSMSPGTEAAAALASESATNHERILDRTALRRDNLQVVLKEAKAFLATNERAPKGFVSLVGDGAGLKNNWRLRWTSVDAMQKDLAAMQTRKLMTHTPIGAYID